MSRGPHPSRMPRVHLSTPRPHGLPSQLSQKSGIPTDEMLFFDDEPYSNMEVTELGVTFVNAEGGISKKMVLAGLEAYEKERC